MKASVQQRLTPWLVGVLVIGLVIALVLLAGAGRQIRWNPPQAEASPVAPTRAVVPMLAKPLGSYAVVWQRPLFYPDRTPAQTPKANASLGEYELSGVILSRGFRMVLLKRHDGSELRLAEHASLPDSGWTLSEVRPRSAVFVAGGKSTELKLPAGAPIDVPAPGQPSVVPGQPGSMQGTSALRPGFSEPVQQNGVASFSIQPSSTRSVQHPPAGPAILQRLKPGRQPSSHPGVH